MIKDGKLILTDQRILWADLKGIGDRWSPPGLRQFYVTIPETDIDPLEAMGWTVRFIKKKGERRPFLKVRINEQTFTKLYPKFILPKPWEETTLVIVGEFWEYKKFDRSGYLLFLEDIRESGDE